MNRDQVKNLLLKLEGGIEDFKVTFSGKTSKKVNGLYYPDRKEIILHNKNFTDDNSIVYTAIHEFAHHIHFVNSAVPVSNRSHTSEFWNIFHRLLFKSEELGIYRNIFETNEEFKKLTKEIKENYLFKNAQLMKDAGRLLIRAIELCNEHKVRFQDYIDRGLMLNRTTADTMVKIYTMNINPEIGFDNMKIASRIRDAGERQKIENDFLDGKTHDMIKAGINNAKKPVQTIKILEAEKTRLERTIKKLGEKLETIREKILELESSN